ncbi:hypothetical protein [Cellulomonas cellasea]|uniref:Uncharacterized protein n=1 Tax=Cellulomonas cellasea TaxID=43670 RepID=A0A7W4YAI1_9CELL|nr:hypothetical protein [Cellulomonas cellasea]MBB2921446.1 hypothetical protein [Cellulomonas cellasea]
MSTDETTAQDTVAQDVTAAEVTRRRLLRMGGMAVAGAAAATAIGSSPASAAAGDPLLAGRPNDAGTAGTRLTATSAAPALSLANPTGAQLRLEPSDPAGWTPQVGEIKNTAAGPLIGLDRDGTGVERGYLVTNLDLQDLVSYLPMLYAPAPRRVLDTRSAAGRASIVGRTAGAIDAAGRVVGGSTIDVALDTATGDLDVASVFLNLTATQGTAPGHVILWPYGVERPVTSSLNYAANQDIANFAVTAVGLFQGRPTIRLLATTTAHLLVDVTAVYGSFPVTTVGGNGDVRSPLLPELRTGGLG